MAEGDAMGYGPSRRSWAMEAKTGRSMVDGG